MAPGVACQTRERIRCFFRAQIRQNNAATLCFHYSRSKFNINRACLHQVRIRAHIRPARVHARAVTGFGNCRRQNCATCHFRFNANSRAALGFLSGDGYYSHSCAAFHSCPCTRAHSRKRKTEYERALFPD